MSFLNETFYNNSVQQWLIALGVAVLAFLGMKIIRAILAKRLGALIRKTRTDIDDLIVELLNRTKTFLFLAVALYIASLTLTLTEKVSDIMRVAVIFAFLAQAAVWGIASLDFWIGRYRSRRIETDPASVTTISALGFVGKIVLWFVILLIALDNLGIQVTGLIAGLGIGGIAIALAVQNILGDLFASLSIVLDKPFVIGDFVIVGDFLGNVEKIGLKTTRIKSLSGEQLIFSNSDLLNSRIRNYKRMFERRVLFGFGVIYQTTYEQIVAIPKMVREIIEGMQDVRFDRAHFKEYGDSSLNFEVVFYVLNPDYNIYMDKQQEINLAIYQQFQEKGIEFAYPTRTLYLNREANGQPEAAIN